MEYFSTYKFCNIYRVFYGLKNNRIRYPLVAKSLNFVITPMEKEYCIYDISTYHRNPRIEYGIIYNSTHSKYIYIYLDDNGNAALNILYCKNGNLHGRNIEYRKNTFTISHWKNGKFIASKIIDK